MPASYRAADRKVKAGQDLRLGPGAFYFGRVLCQRLVVVGDAHLGRRSPEAERSFLQFLEAVPTLGDALLITGDLFEFWFSWRRAVPRVGARVAAALAALRRQVPIVLLGGNHDRWAADFWTHEFDIEFCPDQARYYLAGHELLALHGDGHTETTWSAPLLRRVTSNPFTIGAVRLLHPDLVCWLVDRLTGILARHPRSPAVIHSSAVRQRLWAARMFEEEPGLSLIIMGHTHVPIAEEVYPGRWYLNPGAWFLGCPYAIVTPDRAELANFR